LAEKLGIHQSEIIAVGMQEIWRWSHDQGVWVDNVDPELRDRANLL
jgi:hypothetical protein